MQQQDKNWLTVRELIFLVGWGVRQPGIRDDSTPASLPKKQCAVSFIESISHSELEIGHSQNSAKKCFGDSGGGSYITDPGTHEYILVGVSSHGSPGDDGCFKASFDVRLDHHLDWIQRKLKEACATGIRKTEYCYEL
jgi:hypothetical protein